MYVSRFIIRRVLEITLIFFVIMTDRKSVV